MTLSRGGAGTAVNSIPYTSSGGKTERLDIQASMLVDLAGNELFPNIANGTADSGNPVKIGGLGKSGAPSAVTDGQRVNALFDLFGNFCVTPRLFFTAAGGVALSATGFALARNDPGIIVVPGAGQHVGAGANWDVLRKPTNAQSPYVASSAASGNPAIGKNAAGDVFGFSGNCGATAAWLVLYDVATLPVVGTTAIARTFALPANAAFDVRVHANGLYFANGIGYSFCTSAAGTVGSAAAAITNFNLFIG